MFVISKDDHEATGMIRAALRSKGHAVFEPHEVSDDEAPRMTAVFSTGQHAVSVNGVKKVGANDPFAAPEWAARFGNKAVTSQFTRPFFDRFEESVLDSLVAIAHGEPEVKKAG